jgi:hypothetical protein
MLVIFIAKIKFFSSIFISIFNFSFNFREIFLNINFKKKPTTWNHRIAYNRYEILNQSMQK